MKILVSDLIKMLVDLPPIAWPGPPNHRIIPPMSLPLYAHDVHSRQEMPEEYMFHLSFDRTKDGWVLEL